MILKEKYQAFLFVLPVIVLISSLFFFPLINTIALSFFKYLPSSQSYSFIGLENYLTLLFSQKFLFSLGVSIYFLIIGLIFSFLIGLGMALLLNELSNKKFIIIIRGALIFPWVIAPLVAGLMFLLIFNPSFGILNTSLLKIGLISSNIYWLTFPPFLALNSVIFVDVWKNAPWIMILLLAGLQSIPEYLYDAAKVDGANAIQRFIYITLPGLKPMIIVALLFRGIWVLRTFDIIYILTRGGPGEYTKTLTYLAYEEVFQYFKLTEGSVIITIIVLLTLLFALLYLKFLGRR